MKKKENEKKRKEEELKGKNAEREGVCVASMYVGLK